ncbi:MAG TPA: hypothetical protein VF721_09315 [Pyrinomonadaceae bacterium]
MKRFAVAAAVISAALVFLGSLNISGQSSRNKKILRMEEAVAAAFGNSQFGSLDAKRLRLGKIKLVIEHSLLDGDEQFEVRRFATFKQIERWLQSREQQAEAEGVGKYKLPIRVVDTRAGCRRGICRYYSPNGILHNHLYLKKIFYGYRGGRVYVKKIYLYDGD